MLSYPRPPITEAILHLNFSNRLDRRDIERAAAGFGSGFNKADEVNLKIVVNRGQVSTQAEPSSIRLTGKTAEETIIIHPDAITFAKLAPYAGWDAFFGAGWNVFQQFRKKMGYRQVTRAAIRYVNRIDIPNGPDNTPAVLADYIRIQYAGPLPLGMSAPSAYIIQADFLSSNEWVNVVIRSATVEPALIRHSSVLLDFDVYCDKAIPQTEAELEQLFIKMRDYKNQLFQECVTPAAEQLFGGRQ